LGVVVNFLVKTFPTEPIVSLDFQFSEVSDNDDELWAAMNYMSTQFPELINAEITVYASLATGSATKPPSFSGTFHGLNQTVESVLSVVQPLAEHFNGVGGPGTHAYPRDFNATTPGWRTGFVHSSWSS